MSLFDRITSQFTASEEKKKKAGLQGEFTSMLQENITEARETYVEQIEELERFLTMIQQALSLHMPERITEEDDEEIPEELVKNAQCLFHIAEDKMSAFACILPPVNGGADMTMDTLEKDLRYAGITYGIDRKKAKGIIDEEDYLNPFRVAMGKPCEDGSDGEVKDSFERKASIDIEMAEGEMVDFSQEIQMQIVKKDSIICTIHPAQPAKDGRDVVGNILKGKDGVEVQVTAGENTYLSPSGKQLLASLDGVVSLTDSGEFCVKPQRAVKGSAGRHTGNIYAKEDLYIEGNVNGNIVIKADGNIIIGGAVTEAEITAGKSIRIQKGVSKGKEKTEIHAGGQIQAAVIDGVTVEAEGSIYAEVIMDSEVLSGGSIYATSDRGLIIGGNVKARQNITAKEIGNLSECDNLLWVGYEPTLRQQLDDLKASLKDGEGTLQMLQKNISSLKAVGSHLPQEKKDVLVKLEEQRSLYENRAEEIKAEIKKLTIALHKAANGVVSCEKMYPNTSVQIGEKKTEIRRLMEPCRVFINGDNIVAR